ncbi:MAG TPA: hypothetical protein DHN33_08065 [Eubacteriaceae bacterium]|nr:hypothetical protein [Eubacteriaceae bacterium]
MGECSAVARIGINHKNIPNMVGQITQLLADECININDMLNKSKGRFAYTLIDTDTRLSTDLLDKISNIEGILKTRIIKND